VSDDAGLRAHIGKALDWPDAHADFDKVVGDFPSDLRGQRPKGLPYSAWESLEHMRLAQHDILDFCVNPEYKELEWPKDYWPATQAPPSAAAWDEACAAFRRDCRRLKALAEDRSVDLFARIPHGSGQTYLRELLLVIDHNAHHLGTLIAVRRLLGAWR
jgi:uncharacterized damage-inducible protein DinB